MNNQVEFNKNQQEAINWNEGPLLVLAGPGSGKTMVLTYRAARILRENPESSILALTFTIKAADEMRERLNKLLGKHTRRAHLCTFHSFAGDILRQHGSHIGIRPDFSMLTHDEDKLAFVNDAVKIMKEKKYDIQSIPDDRTNILTLLDKLFSGVNGGIPSWLQSFFKIYCSELKKNNRLDFGALLYFAKELLSTNKAVADLTRLAWEYICIDEFQDTNKTQYDLFRILVPNRNGNLFIVADDDQIIYQWNGASPERLLALRSEYDLKVIQLPENYRCPQEIIDMANRLIANNRKRSPDKKPLAANKQTPMNGDAVNASYFENEVDEINDIASVIQEMKWSYDECVVIARTGKLLEKVSRILYQKGITPYIMKQKNEFETPLVAWIYSILRLALSRHDREFLRRVCTSWRLLTEKNIEINDVETQAALDTGDFLRSWVFLAQKLVNSNYADMLNSIQEQIVDRSDFLNLIESFFNKNYEDNKNNADLVKEEITTWQELHQSLLNEYSSENITLNIYLQELDLKSKTPPQPPNSVRCITVHGAKGLEFKHVFLIGMSEEIFPTFQAVNKGNNSSEMEEERRNCFVAITRVQETLNLSFAQYYNGYPKTPSRFLSEMGFKI
ncbi:MAG: ATP-dependent helicase, partial [Planctomycetaceae bacterium]|nr:ATP-dependent helicase [Planctomycetaceae bacterium]